MLRMTLLAEKASVNQQLRQLDKAEATGEKLQEYEEYDLDSVENEKWFKHKSH